MVSCNSHFKNVLDTNEQVAQIFQGMMMGKLFFILCIKTAVLSKFSLTKVAKLM